MRYTNLVDGLRLVFFFLLFTSAISVLTIRAPCSFKCGSLFCMDDFREYRAMLLSSFALAPDAVHVCEITN